jgi:hydrogenase-1 operon protein HyaF
MSRLSDIPIRSEPLARIDRPAADGGLGGGIGAILSELVTLLERLVATESPGAIDLRSLPMSPLDRAVLQRVLGEGEVQALVMAQGISRVRETRISGVWWVEHFDRQGESVAELIDVSRVPGILTCAIDDVAAGARDLRAQLMAPPAGEEKHAARQ